MGNSRTSFAWLIVSLAVGLVSGLPHVTLAGDAGPGKEVRAIRHDLPILLRGDIESGATNRSTMVIDSIVVDRAGALAEWHANGEHGIGFLTRRYDRWWLEREIFIDGGTAICDEHGGGYGPTSSFLSRCGVPGDLVSLAQTHLESVTSADAHAPKDASVVQTYDATRHAVTETYSVAYHFLNVDTYHRNTLAFTPDLQTPWVGSGYHMSVRFAHTDAAPQARIETIQGRAPTEAESWMARDGNSYFFFSGTLAATAPVHVDAGTTIDVRFPFVLDPAQHYAITIGFTEKPIGPVDGTLKENAVHFVLPAFTLLPEKTIMGEIEATPYAHY